MMKVKVNGSIVIHMKASSFHDRTVATCSVKIGMTRYEILKLKYCYEIRPTKLHIVTVIEVKECVPLRYQLKWRGIWKVAMCI